MATIENYKRQLEEIRESYDLYGEEKEAEIAALKRENKELHDELAALKASTDPLYTTPPTAIALVEDFKRRAVEVCAALNAGYSIPFEAVTQCAELIESLPLIEGEKE